MVRSTSFLLAFAFSCGYVLAAPVNTTLDPGVLLQNGQDAQNLNVQFESLNITDPCQFGALACIAGAEAGCNSEGAWEVQQCPTNTQCFAVPNTRSQGTHLECTTYQEATTLVQDTGAQGDVFGNNSTNAPNVTDPNVGSNTTDPNAGSNTTDPNAVSTDSSATATVTLLVSGSTTQTLDPQTTTIDQAGANSILSSLSTTITTGTDSSSSTATSTTSTSTDPNATPSDTVVIGGAVAIGSAQPTSSTSFPSVILLTPITSPTPSPTVNAAVGSPSPPPSVGGY